MTDEAERHRVATLAAFHEACPRPNADEIRAWIAMHPGLADDIRAHAEASLAEAQDSTGGAEVTPTLIARTRARALAAASAARARAASLRSGKSATATGRRGIVFVDIHQLLADPAAVPLASMAAACGSPCPADDHMDEAVDFNRLLVRNPAATFAVRISGESMRERGLLHGDVATVDRGRQPVNGCIVLAMVDGEFTIKTFRSRDGIITLEPANPDFPDLTVGGGMHFEVWGVLVGIARAL